jgi:hypothetical protein
MKQSLNCMGIWYNYVKFVAIFFAMKNFAMKNFAINI